MLCASFNQDYSCIAIGTDSSFKVFTVEPFRKCFEHEGGMSCVQMLYSTSLLALVGAGQQASLSPRRLQLFNTSEQKVICELNFVSSILNVLLTRRRLVVVLEYKIHIFDINDMKIVRTIETASNKKGICALIERGNYEETENNNEKSNYVSYLAYPYGNDENQAGDIMICDAINLKPINVIRAHKGPLSIIQFNRDGTLLATASNKGTVIRVFSLSNTNLLYTLRRGSYTANIYSIAFSNDSTLLSVSSDTGTVHVFRLGVRTAMSGVVQGGSNNTYASSSSVTNNTDALSSRATGELSSENIAAQKKKQHVGTLTDTIGNLWDSVRDFIHAKVKSTAPDNKNICGISQNGDALFVLTFDGFLHKFSLDATSTGEAKLENSQYLLTVAPTGTKSNKGDRKSVV